MPEAGSKVIGVVVHDDGHHPSAFARRHRMNDVEAFARGNGYTLVRTFELLGSGLHDELALSQMVDVLVESQTRVVIVEGEAPRGLTCIIERAGLSLVEVPSTPATAA